MELLYIEAVSNSNQIEAQYYYYYLNYLIGTKTTVHSNVATLLFLLKNVNKISKSDLLDFNEYFDIQLEIGSKGEEKCNRKEADIFKKEAKRIQKLKSSKLLSKLDRASITLFNEFIIELKNTFTNLITKQIDTVGLNNFIELYDDDILKLSYSLFNYDYTYKDYEIGEKIIRNFITREKLLVIDDLFLFEKEVKMPYKREEVKSVEEEIEINFASQTILKIPCSKDISISNLIIIRNNFQILFSEVLRKIQDFRISLMHQRYDNSIIEKLELFKENIEKEVDKLQFEIDNNIYIQGIKNSDPDYKEVSFRMGIMPYVNILNVFAIKKIISLDKLKKIKSRLSESLEDYSYEVFIYYEINPPINEQQSSNEINN